MKDAAQQLGFDHFNWLQIITSDLQLQACAANTSLEGCSSDFAMAGGVPSIPTADPPGGGYAYNLCPTAESAIDQCRSSFPAQDYWPMYLDEYFSPVPGSDVYYKINPSAPEYLQEYRSGNTLNSVGAAGQSPTNALGFYFSDAPVTTDIVPGTTSTTESISFVDALVGVSGSCNLLVSSNCTFQIIPGTTFKWTATNGVVSPTTTPGGPGASASLNNPSRGVHEHRAKQLNDFPINPVDLTGQDLANSIISVTEFLTLAHLTTASLASMGGGVASFSASLIPSQALALAAVTAGGVLVPPSQLMTTASGLAYSRVSQTFNGTLTLKNISSSAISGPLQVLFTGMPSTVTLVNATGKLSGTSYLTVPTASLAPGQSVTVSVQFTDPSNATINLIPAIYSGSFN
jgi:hypothetical protein